MTPTQKEAALTLFRNVAHKAKLLVDAAESGECDDVEIDNDLAGDMIHTERCVNVLYDVFVERKRGAKKWERRVRNG